MRARIWHVAMLISLCGLVLGGALASGCAARSDYEARFVRYADLKDGTRVAVVVPLTGGTEEQTAYSRFRDLDADEVVVVRPLGRSWETPQWRPDREIVSRGSNR